MMNQPEHMVVDKEGTKVGVADVVVPNDSNIRKKAGESQNSQGQREQLERMWAGRTSVVPVVIGALAAVTLKLEGWLQQKH